MHMQLEWLGYTAGVMTTLSFLPQLYKTWQSKSAHDISYSMYALFSSGLILWTAYGIVKDAVPIVIANSITLILALTILVLKYRFEQQRGKAA
jgi:MtN3 and saliva related transmembrane protein